MLPLLEVIQPWAIPVIVCSLCCAMGFLFAHGYLNTRFDHLLEKSYVHRGKVENYCYEMAKYFPCFAEAAQNIIVTNSGEYKERVQAIYRDCHEGNFVGFKIVVEENKNWPMGFTSQDKTDLGIKLHEGLPGAFSYDRYTMQDRINEILLNFFFVSPDTIIKDVMYTIDYDPTVNILIKNVTRDLAKEGSEDDS